MRFGTLRLIWSVFDRYRWHFAVLVCLGVLSATLEGVGINAAIPLISFFMGGGTPGTDIISQGISHVFAFLHLPFSFRYLLIFILILFMLRAVAVTIFSYVRGWVAVDFLSEESQDMLRRTLLASWPYLLKQKIGTIQNTLVRDIQRTSNLFEVTGQVIQSFSGFCMYLFVAINISPTMTLFTLVGGAVLLLIVRPLLLKSRRMGDAIAETEKGYAQFLTEHIMGMKVLKTAGADRAAIKNGNQRMSRLRDLSLRQVLVRSVSGSLFQPFSLIFVVVLFVISYRSPGFSVAAFAATLYLIQKIFTYLESGQNALHGITELLPYAQNVQKFKKEFGDNREVGVEGTKDFVFKAQLVFDRVSFAYATDAPILSEVSFTLKQGQTLALIGQSGAGKTTTADLLLRLFKPSGGTIMLDGVSISDIAMQKWRAAIGYVAQEVFLFNGTIEENIRFYRNNLTNEDIIAAAKQANIFDFISKLPEGFETVVGDRGVLLSGGQRQRIALARALVHKPQLLILDEATSSLDSESEKLIQEAIHRLRGSVSVFIIAHRLSTIENADTIVVLEKGKVIEVGSPKELLSDPHSYYAKTKG